MRQERLWLQTLSHLACCAAIEYDNGDVIYVSGLTKLASISDIVNLVESVSLS